MPKRHYIVVQSTEILFTASKLSDANAWVKTAKGRRLDLQTIILEVREVARFDARE